MANSATGNAANAAKNLLNQAQGFAGPTSSLYTGFQGSLGTAQGNQANELSGAMSGIQNLQGLSATGGFTPSQVNTLATGGYSPSQQNTLSSGGYSPAQQNILSSGGFNPSQQNTLNTGGYDTDQLKQLNAGYSNLAQTGGFTPQQSQQFIQQATEGTGATYGALEQQAKQAGIATGGLGTAGGLSQMARQLGQVQGQNTLNAEVGLNQLQTSNKLAGLGGESSLAGQVAGNKLTGAEAQAGNILSGAQGQASNVLQGTENQAGNILQGAETQAGNTLQGTEAANNQLSQLYNTTTGQVTQLGNQVLQTLGLDFETQEQAANILAKVSQNPSMFQSLLGMVGGGISAAAGAAAGQP
jgi:hypothetical protein